MSNWNEKHLPNLARVVLGLIFCVFGLNGFFNFLPMPQMAEPGAEFLGALAATGYMMPLIKFVEVIGGVLLLSRLFVPLALVLLVPGVVNIALFHIFLAPSGLFLAAVLVALEGYLAWSYRDVYRPMLSMKTRPTARKAPTERFSYDKRAAAGG